MDQSQESLAALTHFKTLLCFARVGARGLRLRRLFVPLSISDANRNGLAGMTEIHACRQECQFVLQVHFWILMSQMRTQHRHFITYVIPTGALDFTGCSIPWGVSCPCSRWFFGIIFSIEIFIRMVGWGPKPLALRLQRLRHGDSINGRYPNSWMVRNRNSYDNGWLKLPLQERNHPLAKLVYVVCISRLESEPNDQRNCPFVRRVFWRLAGHFPWERRIHQNPIAFGWCLKKLLPALEIGVIFCWAFIPGMLINVDHVLRRFPFDFWNWFDAGMVALWLLSETWFQAAGPKWWGWHAQLRAFLDLKVSPALRGPLLRCPSPKYPEKDPPSSAILEGFAPDSVWRVDGPNNDQVH